MVYVFCFCSFIQVFSSLACVDLPISNDDLHFQKTLFSVFNAKSCEYEQQQWSRCTLCTAVAITVNFESVLCTQTTVDSPSSLKHFEQ